MPPQLLILLLVIAAAAIFLHAFLKASPAHVAKKIKQIGFYVAIGLVILIAIVKLNWIVAAIGAIFAALPRLLPLLRFLPILKWIQSWQKKQAGYHSQQRSNNTTSNANTSKVSSRYVTMILNHDTGELDGDILEGQFSGQRLSAMTQQAVIQLYEECIANDGESAALIETYLDRVYGEDWRDTTGSGQNRSAPDKNGNMSRAEALEILGLSENASEGEIIQAHRRLMQKMHPDRGGSDYLAAKINQAKDVLTQ